MTDTENAEGLQPTSWLAKRLGISEQTISRLRSINSSDIPPHLTFGIKCIRYDTAVVEDWIKNRCNNTQQNSINFIMEKSDEN